MGKLKILSLGVIVSVYLFGILQSSSCFKCYVCNSVLHTKCGTSPPSLEYMVECTDSTAQPTRGLLIQRNDLEPQPESRRNYTFCRKSVASIPRQDNRLIVREAETRTVRSCGWLEPEKADRCKWGATDGVHREMCSCIKEACNSGLRLGPEVKVNSGLPPMLLVLTYRIFI